MQEEIKNLEEKLAKAKEKDLFERWESYLDKVKAFAESLKGKTLLSWYRNGRFIIFKVEGYEEKYYLHREGAYGQWSPKRWIEIKSRGFLLCSVADSEGRWYDTGVSNQDYSNFKFYTIKSNRKKKLEELHIAKINFDDDSINNSTWGDINDRAKIGFTEYDKYSEDPNYDRALDPFLLFTFIVPDSMWDDAWEIYKTQVESTMKWWNKYENVVKNAKRVTS